MFEFARMREFPVLHAFLSTRVDASTRAAWKNVFPARHSTTTHDVVASTKENQRRALALRVSMHSDLWFWFYAANNRVYKSRELYEASHRNRYGGCNFDCGGYRYIIMLPISRTRITQEIGEIKSFMIQIGRACINKSSPSSLSVAR